MKYNPTPEEVKKFWKLISIKYDTKVIYTGGTIGKIYKKVVMVPIVKKALKKYVPEGTGEPSEWIDRVITGGKYIAVNFKIGSTSKKAPSLWEQMQICVHEHTHKKDIDIDGLDVFYHDYYKSPGIRANYEISARKGEIALDIWNGVSIASPEDYVRSFRNGYGFTPANIRAMKQNFQTLVQILKKTENRAILDNPVAEYGIKIIETKFLTE